MVTQPTAIPAVLLANAMKCTSKYAEAAGIFFRWTWAVNMLARGGAVPQLPCFALLSQCGAAHLANVDFPSLLSLASSLDRQNITCPGESSVSFRVDSADGGAWARSGPAPRRQLQCSDSPLLTSVRL